MNMIPLVMANEPGRAQTENPRLRWIVVLRRIASVGAGASLFGTKHQRGWESRLWLVVRAVRSVSGESRTLELVRKMGGAFLLKLNIDRRPIAYKYSDGKMKRTLERELTVPEIAKWEANETSSWVWNCWSRCGNLRLHRKGSLGLWCCCDWCFLDSLSACIGCLRTIVVAHHSLRVWRRLPFTFTPM